MDIQQIHRYLPHRYPFLLVDRVLSVEPFGTVRAVKNVSVNEPQFTGHFPNNPVMPGVLIIEALAQAAGILGFVSADHQVKDGYMYLFAGIEKARFKKTVAPGDVVTLEAKYLTHKRHVWKFDCAAYVDGEVVASAVITSAETKV